MYPIHDYHLYFSSAGAQADVRSLYYTIRRRPVDVSLVNLLIEKGESKYSTGSNVLFVLGGVCISVCVCVCTCAVCVCARVCVCVHTYELQTFKHFIASLGTHVYVGSACVSR